MLPDTSAHFTRLGGTPSSRPVRAACAVVVVAATCGAVALIASTSYRHVTSAALTLDLPIGWSTECFTWTGGTCWMLNCNAERGDTVCDTHRCMCPHGCAGGDGKCYNGQKNIKVAGGFKLKNMKWPDQIIYIPSGLVGTVETQLRTSTAEGSKFDLFRLPDETYMLASSEWPDFVVGISLTEIEVDGMGATRWDVRAHRLGYWTGGLTPSSLHLCNPGNPTHPEAVVLTNVYPETNVPATIFLQFGSWEVYGYTSGSDPGEGGYWIPEPLLPFELPSCNLSQSAL